MTMKTRMNNRWVGKAWVEMEWRGGRRWSFWLYSGYFRSKFGGGDMAEVMSGLKEMGGYGRIGEK